MKKKKNKNIKTKQKRWKLTKEHSYVSKHISKQNPKKPGESGVIYSKCWKRKLPIKNTVIPLWMEDKDFSRPTNTEGTEYL